MRSLLSAITVVFSCVPVLADTDPQPHVSPDGRYAIRNVGDTASGGHYFEIQTKDGEVLLTTDDKEWQRWLPTHARDIMWSRDSRFVLLRYDAGKYYSTALYSFADRQLFDLSHVTDGWTVPVRWVSSRTFVVENSGPHGGKARGGGYHFRATYRVRMQPFRLDCVYTSPPITREDDSEEK